MSESGGNSLPNFVPRNGLGRAGIEIGDAPGDLLVPGALGARVSDFLQALDQRANERGAFFLGKSERLLKKLQSLLRHRTIVHPVKNLNAFSDRDWLSGPRSRQPQRIAAARALACAVLLRHKFLFWWHRLQSMEFHQYQAGAFASHDSCRTPQTEAWATRALACLDDVRHHSFPHDSGRERGEF